MCKGVSPRLTDGFPLEIIQAEDCERHFQSWKKTKTKTKKPQYKTKQNLSTEILHSINLSFKTEEEIMKISIKTAL